jgi:hypothetical protein
MAIANYEKALALKPGDKEIKEELIKLRVSAAKK